MINALTVVDKVYFAIQKLYTFLAKLSIYLPNLKIDTLNSR